MVATDTSLLKQIGERLTRHRLRRDWTQDQLAHEAGVSRRTVARLEAGEASQLVSFLRVLRALDLLGELDALLPMPGPSPMEQLRNRGRSRQRASGKPPHRGPKSPWRWGDEEDER